MKIQLEVSEANEGTDSPWWAIIDPKQNMGCSVHSAAGQITGPFFSREEAQGYLDGKRHRFGKKAEVYCLSGCYSRQYRTAWNKGNGGWSDTERVMANLTNHANVERPLWACVMGLFGFGSERSRELCGKYDYDPDETLSPGKRATKQAQPGSEKTSENAPKAVESEECLWLPDDSEDYGTQWMTGCGKSWEFIEDGPLENGMKYCHNCGKRVRVDF